MAKIAKDKYIFGTVKVGERGQIVIPQDARKIFNIKPGDLLFVVGDINKGIAITKMEGLKGQVMKMLGAFNENTKNGELNSDELSDSEEISKKESL